MEPNKFYAVFIGSKIGVFSTRQEAEEQTVSYPDGYYDIYTSQQEAIEALERFFMGVPAESLVSGNDQYPSNKISNV